MSHVELKELRAQRVKLEKQNQLLETQQKTLEDDIEVLGEKVEINELLKSQKELEQVILNLETQNNDLEYKLHKAPC